MGYHPRLQSPREGPHRTTHLNIFLIIDSWVAFRVIKIDFTASSRSMIRDIFFMLIFNDTSMASTSMAKMAIKCSCVWRVSLTWHRVRSPLEKALRTHPLDWKLGNKEGFQQVGASSFMGLDQCYECGQDYRFHDFHLAVSSLSIILALSEVPGESKVRHLCGE